MRTLIGGSIAAVLGAIGLAVYFGELMQLLAGILPSMLLVGGALAMYLGIDELKDSWNNDAESKPEEE